MAFQMTRSTSRGIGLMPAAIIAGLILSSWVWGQDAAAPLPPPPELTDTGYEPDDYFEATVPATSEELAEALAPPTVLSPEPIATSPTALDTAWPEPATATYVEPAASSVIVVNPYHDFTISPPARDMPSDYYMLPMDGFAMNDDAIPGIIMPEIDDQFYDPGYRPPARSLTARRSLPGLSVRQLEPFFALAKGSEGMALEAQGKGDDATYREQITKAVDAYMAIIGMADSGSEAREEAWYGVARCEYRRGNWWAAYDSLERSFPQQYERAEVEGRIKLEMFIGERLWRIGNDPAPEAVVDGKQLNGYQAASHVYAAAIFNKPNAKDAPLALLRRGDACALEGDWKEAVKFYRQVTEYFPESDQAMQARASLAEAVLRQEWPGGFPEGGRDDLSTLMGDVERSADKLSQEAEERRQRAVELANNMEAETKLRHAKDYLKSIRVRKSRDAGVFLLGEVVSRFPTTDQAREAAAILRDMGIEPPMALSDGRRFPIGPGWAEDQIATETTPDGGFVGGSVELGGQNDITNGMSASVLLPSPTRETVYEAVPGIVME